MSLGRLLMRLLIVPLGAAVAVCVAVLVVIAAHWNRFMDLAAAYAGSGDDLALLLFVAGPWIAFVRSVSAVALMLPAALCTAPMPDALWRLSAMPGTSPRPRATAA